jgi:hypothetical protein
MDETANPTRSRSGRVLGSVAIAAVFGFLFLVFWFTRFLFKDPESGAFGNVKTLNDLFWSHVGSSLLFLLVGAAAIALLWVRPGRRPATASVGALTGILSVVVFRLVIGQFNPGQGIGAGFFYLMVAALMVISALAAAVLLVVTLSLLVRRLHAN